MIILGLDLSLTSPGMVVWDGEQVVHHANPKTAPKMGSRELRISHIAEHVVDIVQTHDVDHVWIEAYAFGRVTSAATLGELGGVVRHELWMMSVPFSEVVSSSAKKFAAGHGRASKQEMILAAAPYLDTKSDDVADAVAIARYGWAQLA